MLTGNIQGIRFKMKHFMDTSIAWITCIIYEAQFVCFVICQVPFCDMSGSVLWYVRFRFMMCQVLFCDVPGSVLWCVRFRFVMRQVPFCDVSGSVLWCVRFRFVICQVPFCDMLGSVLWYVRFLACKFCVNQAFYFLDHPSHSPDLGTSE